MRSQAGCAALCPWLRYVPTWGLDPWRLATIRPLAWTGSGNQKTLREPAAAGGALLLARPVLGSRSQQVHAVLFDVAIDRLDHRAMEQADAVFQGGRRRQHAGDGKRTIDLLQIDAHLFGFAVLELDFRGKGGFDRLGGALLLDQAIDGVRGCLQLVFGRGQGGDELGAGDVELNRAARIAEAPFG